jgi:hypothetical protein
VEKHISARNIAVKHTLFVKMHQPRRCVEQQRQDALRARSPRSTATKKRWSSVGSSSRSRTIFGEQLRRIPSIRFLEAPTRTPLTNEATVGQRSVDARTEEAQHAAVPRHTLCDRSLPRYFHVAHTRRLEHFDRHDGVAVLAAVNAAEEALSVHLAIRSGGGDRDPGKRKRER